MRRALPALFTMCLLGLGLLVALDDEPSSCGLTSALDQAVQANVTTLQLALEAYAGDHKGRYPPAGAPIRELTRGRRGYLPDNLMPPSPWTGDRQPEALGLADTGLPTARAIATGTAPAPPGHRLGRGEAPRKYPVNAWQYGAVLYDYDPQTNTYVLYGIGRQRDKYAYVVCAFDNHTR